MQAIAKDVLMVTRQVDKKQIIFYHDHSIQFEVHDDFKQLWRNTSVDGMQDDNIDEYLNKQVTITRTVAYTLYILVLFSTHSYC